ncbi:MAG TPA: tetratricopeptide repeat protein [Anaerohalosphaeraceae bacterium]|nr:tetratricopeptide repeat protein [Anaerohalosphaeraceae bacterium]HPO70996.1 tetratricopeptide repeat protein [Anaerohalosphaeraceae bacterium]
MRKAGRQKWAVWLLLAFLPAVWADTYYLSSESGWQTTDSPEGKYLLSMSKLKQQLLTGKPAEAAAALEQIKTDFPDMAGKEIDSYIAAEKLYAAAKWDKAAALYKKFIDAWPDSILQPAAMERIYAIGAAYLQGHKRTFLKVLKLPAFDTGADLMRDVADRAGQAPIALRALTTLAENQERREKFLDAYQTWSEIKDRWPTGEVGRDALLRMARALHASYKGTEYDASVLPSAATYYEQYNGRYPDQAAQLEIPAVLDTIEQQQAYKLYATGFYYERTGRPEAARKYYTKVVTAQPDTAAAQMAQARLAPDAPPAVKKTLRRRTVGLTERFLDSWFGLAPLLGAKEKQGN